jgi:hypothetical protein
MPCSSNFCFSNIFSHIPLGLSLLLMVTGMAFFSCTLPTYSSFETSGALSIALDTADSAGSRSISPASYLFSGTGPEGEEFSILAGPEGVSVDYLKTGIWTIRGEGFNEAGELLVTGESTLMVEPGQINQVSLNLAPLPGEGSINVRAQWNANHTVSPAARVIITGGSGESETYSLTLAGSGAAEGLFSGLAAGNYLVAVQILDSGELVTGSAWTVRVLKDQEVELMVPFDLLNKVGKRIEITEEEFTIAWDSDYQDGFPDEYRMYYRHRGEESWVLLSSVPYGSDPSFLVSRDILAYGTYEFAVSSVEAGNESDLHTSMDDTADPGTGWYVDWMGV